MSGNGLAHPHRPDLGADAPVLHRQRRGAPSLHACESLAVRHGASSTNACRPPSSSAIAPCVRRGPSRHRWSGRSGDQASIPAWTSPRAKSRAQRRDVLQDAHTRARSLDVVGAACRTNSGSIPNSCSRCGSNSDGPLWPRQSLPKSSPLSPTSEAMRLSSPGGQAANSLIVRRLLRARRQVWRRRVTKSDACWTIICSSKLQVTDPLA